MRILGKPYRYLRRAIALMAAMGLLLLLTTCIPRVSTWRAIQQTGVVQVAMVNSAKTYYLGRSGPAGFEYDLARRFAQSLGLKLEIKVVPNRHRAIKAVRHGNAHFAAGLAITPARQNLIRFTPTYYRRQFEVVVHTNTAQPDSISDIEGKVVIPAYTAATALLQRRYPADHFTIRYETNSEELLAKVANKSIAATIADANIVMLNQRYYPQLRVAFSLPYQAELAWAFPPDSNQRLYNKAVAFIHDMRDSTIMKVLRDRYFGHADRLGFVGGMVFARAVKKRLDQWRAEFKAAAKQYGFDWRLLAAMSYQESYWHPDAVSSTGVRGLMMLTISTAHMMGVDDRTNPKASIFGGAKYLEYLLGRLPKSIEPPDRIWTALAAYNVGLSHVMDARSLLKRHGQNPNRWVNIRQALKWLTRESYYKQTQFGYARGHQAVTYVGNIRAYYDILLWMSMAQATDMLKPLSNNQKNKQTNPKQNVLQIDTPTL